MTREVRTRFAPSPTGFQHIGGLRTAFFAWLLAKHHGGKFVLRVEDTDQERRVPGAIKFIIEELAWFGIRPDEGPSKSELEKVNEVWEGMPDIGGPHGPYIQSQRLDKYKAAAETLIASGHAYRCDCTSEMLEKERNEQMARKELPGYSGYCRTRNVPATTKHVVRFKMPHKRPVTLADAVKGNVVWESASLRDTVLLKSDGFPTYHLAVVVDDHDMQISHIIRTDEWLSSTPLHLLLFEAFGWEAPIIAHPPPIMGNDGKKLSKRHGAASSADLRAQGFLPEALFNFVILIGWSPGEGEEQEVFSKEELIQRFSLEGVNKAGGVFDPNKLAWMNGVYLRSLPPERFLDVCREAVEKAGMKVNEERLKLIVPHIQERVKTLLEIAPMIDFLFIDKITRETKEMFQKGIDAPKAREIIDGAVKRITVLPEFTIHSLEEALRPMAEEFGLKLGPLFGVLRIAVTGKKVTPPLFESFFALGKDTVLARLAEARNELETA